MVYETIKSSCILSTISHPHSEKISISNLEKPAMKEMQVLMVNNNAHAGREGFLQASMIGFDVRSGNTSRG